MMKRINLFIRKTVSLILCLAMIFAAGVFTDFGVSAAEYAARIGSTQYRTLADAVSAASNGDTIYMISDAIVDSSIKVTKSITITSDGGARTIKRQSSLADSVFEVTGELTVYGGEGSLKLDGGGTDAKSAFIHVNGGTLTMSYGCTITANKNTSGRASAVEITGGVFNFYGGYISGNTSNGYGNAVYVSDNTGTLRMSANATLAQGSSVYLPSGAYVEITGELSGSGPLAIYADNVLPGRRVASLEGGVSLSENQLSRFTVSDGLSSYSVDVNGTELIVSDAASSADQAKIGDKTYKTLAQAIASVGAGESASITLISNVTIDSCITVSDNKKITLIPDGTRTLLRASAFTSEELIKIDSGASLTLCNGSGVLNINGSGVNAYAPAVSVSGTFTMNAGAGITGSLNLSSDNSRMGIVNISGGTFNMCAGTITQNSSSGGIVHITSGSFNMSGGQISDNSGSGIAVWNAGTFKLSGKASVLSSASHPCSVYLAGGKVITVDSAWTPAQAPDGYTGIITVNPEKKDLGTAVAKFTDASGKAAPAKTEHFCLDSSMTRYALLAKDDSLVIANANEVYEAYIGNKGYRSLAEAVNAVTGADPVVITVANDCVIKETVVISQGRNITLYADKNPDVGNDFTSRTIRRASEFNEAMFIVEEGSWLTLAAADSKALILDGEGRAVLRAAVITNGILNLTNGSSIVNNRNEAAQKLDAANTVCTFGGAVYVDEKGEVNVSGGTVSGCYASFGGGIYVKDGMLKLSGGEISSNEALLGGGVYLETSRKQSEQPDADAFIRACFDMTDGTLSSNKAYENAAIADSGSAGAVYVGNGSYFAMSGGTLNGNTASRGAGVCVGKAASADDKTIDDAEFAMSSNAQIGKDDGVYLAAYDKSYIRVTSALTAQSNPVVISIPSDMPQNMKLVKYNISENKTENESAALNAFNRGTFTLDKAASEYYITAIGGDRSVILNAVSEGSFTGYKGGRHYNGIAQYEEENKENAQNAEQTEQKTEIIYDPITVLPNGVFTAYYEMTYYPNLYKNMYLMLTAPFPKGTRIAMIDYSDEENIGYYYYEVTGEETVVKEGEKAAAKAADGSALFNPDVIEIPITSFCRMGTKDTFYASADAAKEEKTDLKTKKTDKMLFVVDFAAAEEKDSLSLEGDFTMVWNHYYPGSFEGERFDISSNIKQTEYTVASTTASTVNLEVNQNTFSVSYVLDADSACAAENSGVIMLQLNYGTFTDGTVFTDADGNQYLAAKRATVITVPLPRDENGNILLTGAVTLEMTNYYGSAMLNSTVRAVIAPSSDGEHFSAGAGYDASSEGARFSLEAADQYSVLVTTTDQKKKPYYENYDSIKNETAIPMIVKGLYNTTETDTFNLSLLKKDGDDYLPCTLSELFDVGEEYGSEVILDTGAISLTLTKKLEELRGNEYKLKFTVGDAVEYVKVNFTDKK